jgi:hypothetical protein
MATGGGGYSRRGRNTPKKPDLPFGAIEAEPPAPPAELGEEEAEIWCSFIDRMPPNFFSPPTFPILVNLCRHIRNSRMFARKQRELEEQLPHALDEQHAKLLMSLSRAQALESRIIALLSARLKLTPITPHRARRTEQRPWDIPGDGDGDGLQ